MKAFLISDEFGTRLNPPAGETPACVRPAGGRSRLHTWLEHLERHGIEEVLVNFRPPGEQVEVFMEDAVKGRTKISVYHEYDRLGNAGIVLANRSWVAGSGPFLILNGDVLTGVNLGAMISFHCRHGLPLTLGVVGAGGRSRRRAFIETEEDGTVTAFSQNGCGEPNFAEAGVYIADRRIFDFFPARKTLEFRPLNLWRHVVPNMLGRMKTYFIQEFSPLDIGTSHAYEAAHALWRQRSGAS